MASKKAYIKSNHTYHITQMQKGRHKGFFKTYVRQPDGKLKQIERKTMDDMVNALYRYYSGGLGRDATLAAGFESLMQRKLEKGRAQSTIENNRHTFNRFATTELQSKPMARITADDIYKSIRTTLDTVRPSMADIRAYLQIINGIYDLMGSRGFVFPDPAEHIKASDFKDAVAQPKTASERVFTPREVELILEELRKQEPSPRAFAIEIAVYTGMRSGELPCLRWEDIDDGYIHVHRSMQIIYNKGGRREGFNEVPWTKDEKGIPRGGRYVPIMPHLQEVLDRIRECQKKRGIITDRVICGEEGEAITNKSIERVMNRTCRKLELSATGIHSLRRAFVTNVLLPIGLTATERASILGHSAEVDERYYLVTVKGKNDVLRERVRGFKTA